MHMKRDVERRLEQRLGHLDTLPNIANDLGLNISTVNRWADKHKKNDFPAPVRHQGRYRLYNRSEVEEWIYLRLRIIRNAGNDIKSTGDEDKE